MNAIGQVYIVTCPVLFSLFVRANPILPETFRDTVGEPMSILSACRFSHALPAFALFGLLGGGTAYANQITITAVDQGYQKSTIQPTFTTNSSLETGQALPDFQAEFRFVLEFDLSGLPAGAVVTDAELGLRTARPDLAGTTTLRGFTGDGTITTADLTVGTDVLSFTQMAAAIEFHNLTAFIQSELASSAMWAGLSARQNPLGTCSNSFASGNGGCAAIFDSPPQLVITYSVSTAAPEPSSIAMMLVGGLGLLSCCIQRKRRA